MKMGQRNAADNGGAVDNIAAVATVAVIEK